MSKLKSLTEQVGLPATLEDTQLATSIIGQLANCQEWLTLMRTRIIGAY